MNSGQKMIKYFAILLAASLTIGIIATVVNIGLSVVGVFVSSENKNDNKSNRHHIEESQENEKNHSNNNSFYEYDSVENLNVDSSVYKVIIQRGSGISKVRVELDNIPSSYEVSYDESSKTMNLEDEDWIGSIFKKKARASKGKVYIYVPEGKTLNKFTMNMGVGTVEILDISFRGLDIKCGVGKLICTNVSAESAELEGGVGSINLENVSFENFQLEGGVGDINVEGKLTGKTVISAGMGSIDVDINGRKDEYNYNVETGLGSIYIDGEKTGGINFNNNNCFNLLDIEGGIGTIHVNFQ